MKKNKLVMVFILVLGMQLAACQGKTEPEKNEEAARRLLTVNG